MESKLFKLNGRKSQIRWDEKNEVTIQHVASLEVTGYVVATRRTPDDLDVAHVVNFDVVLCAEPFMASDRRFDERAFYCTINRPCDFLQFHLAASESQMRMIESFMGKRVTLRGLTSIVCWEGADGEPGHLNCFDPEFLDMVDFADEEEYERGRFHMGQGMTPCHVLFNPRVEEDPTYTDVAWELLVAAVKAPATALKMIF